MSTDHVEILEAIGAFAAAELDPLTSRSEAPASPEVAPEVVKAAVDLGLLADEPSGIGLWEDESSDGTALSAAALTTLAQSSPGIAWHLSALAVGAVLCRELGAGSSLCVVGLQSGQGWSRGALGKLLSGEELSEDEALITAAELPSAGGSILVQVADGVGCVAVPWLDGARLQWSVLDTTLNPIANSHGLEETRSCRVELPPELSPAECADPTGLFCRTLSMTALSTLAVGLGSADAAVDRAAKYASERVQGGTVIAEHAAVQILLGRSRAAVESVLALLQAAGPIPADLEGLERVLALHATGHELLCRAATDALQVLGGYGYMRDYGLEKALRDAQHLKLLVTSPRSTHLLLGRSR